MQYLNQLRLDLPINNFCKSLGLFDGELVLYFTSRKMLILNLRCKVSQLSRITYKFLLFSAFTAQKIRLVFNLSVKELFCYIYK